MAATTTAGVPRADAVRAGWLHRLLTTENDATATLLRVTLGVAMLPHGLQKVFGWFGGHGFEGTMGFLTGGVGLPWIVAFLVIAIESAGAVMLIAGLGTRLAALGTAAVMVGAVVTSHLSNGFFMNWSGQQAGEGFEYHLLALGIAAAVFIKGGGAASADRAIAGR